MDRNTCPVPKKLLFLITIVNGNTGEAVAEYYRTQGLDYIMIAPGYGAAGFEFLDYLGMTETEKDMVIAVGSEDLVNRIMPLAEKALHLYAPGHGIAFTVPVAGISGPRALYYVTGYEERIQREEHQDD